LGPGGGNIFYVDSLGQFSDFDYLELAPVGWGNGIPVDSAGGETTGTATIDPLMNWCSSTHNNTLIGLSGMDAAALGAGATNTATADITCTGGAIQAVSNYAGGSKDDWYLPSAGEASVLYTNMQRYGISGLASDGTWIVTSTERRWDYVYAQDFLTGQHIPFAKNDPRFTIRPIRKF
jgi:hypothetical protein